MSKPIVWTIAGSDSGGGAGIQADLHTLHALGVHGCSVITAITAQNSQTVRDIEFCSNEIIAAQIAALSEDLPPRAIKLGMLGSIAAMRAILPALEKFSAAVIYDPVLFATSGNPLHAGEVRRFLLDEFLARVTLLTPNISEAEWLLGKKITSNDEMESAARELMQLGPKAVLLKGGHAAFQQHFSQDFLLSDSQACWLTSHRQTTLNKHGGGCTLASAIAACLAQNYSLEDACVIAKAYLNQGLRHAVRIGQGPGPVEQTNWPEDQRDFPWMTASHQTATQPFSFLNCGDALGFYPIVDSYNWVKLLLECGVTTLQIRIKYQPLSAIESELKKCVALAKQYGARLFINDDWQTAIKLGAYGVHLGQEDLETADCAAIQAAGLRLGVSTHSYAEAARAHAYRPSYLAFGPIYHTDTKQLAFAPQGLEKLRRYCRTFDYPVVAIGGITWENAANVAATGVDGIAVISALVKAQHPEHEVARWMNLLNHHYKKVTTCLPQSKTRVFNE